MQIGIGFIRIRMYDSIVGTRTHIQYVPKLEKNLISIKVIGDKGLNVT